MAYLGKGGNASHVDMPRAGKDDEGEGGEAQGEVVGKVFDVVFLADACGQILWVECTDFRLYNNV